MNVLIVEDEAPSVDKLERLLKQYDANLEIIGTTGSVKKTVEWFENSSIQPDVILMDIRLSDGLSFDVFQQVAVKSPVIFITAYDQYAIQAFKSNGIDYLLKPVDYQELKDSLDRFKEKFETKPETETELLQKIENLMKNFHSDNYKSRFLVKSGQKLIVVSVNQIAYFYKDEIVLLITKNGDKYSVNYSLEELEKILNPQDFFRVNRQFIVQTEAIESIHPYFKGKIKLELNPETSQEVIISQEKAPIFKMWLNQ